MRLSQSFRLTQIDGAVGVAREAQQTEAGDRRATLDSRRGQNDVFHLLANRHRAVHGSGEGKLDVDVEKPLVFFRQEAGRERFAKPTGGQRHEAEKQQAEGGFANQRPAQRRRNRRSAGHSRD